MRYSVKSAPPPSGDRNEFVMSDAKIDRMGDVIEADGWQLQNFKAHPIALFNHDPNQVIGTWTDVKVQDKQLRGRLEFAEQGTSALVDTVRALHDQGILRAVSVGFRPLEQKPLDADADKYFGPFRFIKSELLECSLVAVPANPRALNAVKSLGLTGDMLAEVFRKTVDEPRPHLTPSLAKHLPPKTGNQMNLSHQIEGKQNQINTWRDQLAAIVNKENRDGDDDILVGELPAKIEAEVTSLQQLRDIERAMGMSATTPTPTKSSPSSPAIITGKTQVRPIERKGDLVVRRAVIGLVSELMRRNPEDVLRDMYGNDEQTGMVLRAASNPATTTQAGWAAELAQTSVADFVDLHYPNRLYPQLASRGLRINFGRSAQVKIPGRAATPQLAGDWIAEGAPIPVKQMGFVSVTLALKKLGVISVMTREILAHSTPMIETLVRDAMGTDTSLIIDTKLISNAAATAVAPPGLLNGVSATTPSASTVPATAMIDDIGALVNAIYAVNGGTSLVIMVNPAQAWRLGTVLAPNGTFLFDGLSAAGDRFGVSFVASTTVPAKTVICVDAAEFASVTGDVAEFSVSEQATLHMEDTAPLPIVTGAQGSGVVASPTRSLFQTASIGIRYLLDMNWTMRRVGMVSWTQNVLW